MRFALRLLMFVALVTISLAPGMAQTPQESRVIMAGLAVRRRGSLGVVRMTQIAPAPASASASK
jgi:hypothetical protein